MWQYNYTVPLSWGYFWVKGMHAQGRRKQPGVGPAKLSTIPRITGTQIFGGIWGHVPLKEMFEN